MWLSTDPLQEKYPNISSYAYTFQNPVKFIDPTGMVVEDPDELYESHKQEVTKMKADIETYLKGESVTDDQRAAGNKLIDEYKKILSEYKKLEESSNIYRVYSDPNIQGGGVGFHNGVVHIAIGENTVALTGHELKHAYQFETGKVSFMLDGTFGTLYDLSDETEAYNRQAIFETGISYFTDPGNNKWTNEKVLQFGKTAFKGEQLYQNLPTGPISIGSREGKAMRDRMVNAGLNRQYPIEVYKDALKDWNKGKGKRK